MRIAIITQGCRTNQAESLAIEGQLRAAGHDVVAPSASPDLCILNTCSVTSRADADARRAIDQLLKKEIPSVVTGCFAELYHGEIEETLLKRGARLVRNAHKHHIISMLPEPLEKPPSPSLSGSRTRPIVKVQEGCNYACSYCIVPRVRGRSRSVPPEEVLREVRRHESEQKKEVVLSGTHLGTYGIDLQPALNLTSLLNRLLKGSAIPRIRLSSLEIKELDEDFLDVLSDTRMCKHLHVPLQSGNDKVLRLMNRRYRAEDFRRTIELIAGRFPDIALGTDIIVGFPGEGEEEFNCTRALVESLPLSYLHVFPYSDRPGTPSAHFGNTVTDRDKKRRLAVLRDLSARKRVAYMQAQQGKSVDALIEKAYERGFAGTSSTYIKVLLASGEGLEPGMLIDVAITGFEGETAVAVPVRTEKVPQV